jgi:NifU-like protein
MWDYSEKLMDHFLNPRNSGEVEDANAVGQIGSLVCGDSMKLTMKVDPETEKIVEAKFLTFGCGSAIASASALTEMIIGKTLDEAAKVSDDDIAKFLEGLPPEKMHCSVMGSDALKAAIADFRGEEPPESHVHEEDIVCHCFSVTKQKIEQVVKEHGLTSVEEVTQYTKAGGACGKCKGKIADIILAVRNPDASKGPRKPMTNLQRIQKITEALDSTIRPMLQADGGDVELVDVEGTKVIVALQGRCASCFAAGQTLSNVVETKLRELVDPNIVVEEGSTE